MNQASLGFSRLSVPIFNATIDGQYPIKAGLRGLPAGEADSSFPEIAFAGPNAPTQWRGTDARAFTEYLNNYTFQNNLNWTHGKHALTFGLQAQRMDANERERTYGSLATFGFSNVQTAGFSRDRHAADDHRQRVRELPARRSERDQRDRGLARSRRADASTPTPSGRRTTSSSGPTSRSTSGCATTS